MRILQIFLLLVGIVILFSLGRLISISPLEASIIIVVAFIFSFLTLINLEVGLFLLIFAVPFTQQFRLFGYGYHGAIDVGTDDLLILFITFSWLLNLVRKKEPAFLKTSLNWPFITFFTAAIFSFFGAESRFGTGTVLIGFLHLLKFYEYIVVFYIVVSAIDKLNQIERFLKLFFIVVSVIAVVQLIAMYISMAIPGTYSYIGYMHAIPSNAVLGAYYCFFIPILVAIILEMPDPQKKLFLIPAVILFSFMLFKTFSRSAYAGFFASFLVLIIFSRKRLPLIILSIVIFGFVFFQSDILKRITMTVQSVKPTITLDYSAASRIATWKLAFKAFLKNPIFGTGYWTTRWVLNYEAHSQYLAMLVETGIVGFLFFCWLIINMIRNSLNLIKKTNAYFLKALAAGYLAGLAGVLISCLFSENLEAFQVSGSIWFVTGLIVSANRLLLEKSQEPITIDST